MGASRTSGGGWPTWDLCPARIFPAAVLPRVLFAQGEAYPLEGSGGGCTVSRRCRHGQRGLREGGGRVETERPR
jgi:hypothetical protein